MSTQIIRPPAFQKPSGKLYLLSSQLNLVNGVATKVLFDTIAPNYKDAIEDIANSRIVLNATGFYLVVAHVFLTDTVADKAYKISIYENGAEKECDYKHSGNNTLFQIGLEFTCLDYIEAGHYIEVFVTSQSGIDTADIYGGADKRTFLAIQRIR